MSAEASAGNSQVRRVGSIITRQLRTKVAPLPPQPYAPLELDANKVIRIAEPGTFGA